MASIKQEIKYKTKSKKFSLKAREKGRPVEISITSSNDYGKTKSTKTNRKIIYVLPFKDIKNFNGDVEKSDILFYAESKYDLRKYDLLTDNGQDLKLVKVNPVQLGQTIILYEIQCRA